MSNKPDDGAPDAVLPHSPLPTSPAPPSQLPGTATLRLLTPSAPLPPAPPPPRYIFASDISYDVIEEALELKVGSEDRRAEEQNPDADPSERRRGKLARLLDLIRDPEYGIHGTIEPSDLGLLMRKAQVSYFDVFSLLTEHWTTLHSARKAQARMKSAAEHLDAFFDDVAQDAISRDVPCNDCTGSGSVQLGDGQGGTLTLPCDTCKGSGVQRRAGDAKSREQFIKIHGLDDAKGNSGASGGSTTVNVAAQAGVKVQNNNNGEQQKADSVLTRVDSILGR